MAKKPTEVQQVAGAEVPAAIIAQSIVDISKGMKNLLSGPLSERALLVLIQDAAGGKSTVSLQTIRTVLAGISSLERLYTKNIRRR